MIFLSHNYKDKPVVEQVALKLSAIYGQQNVFYDSWSIQPGDGIIDKMEEGLRNCFEFLQKVFLGLMYSFSCVLWAIFWSFPLLFFVR